MTFQSDAALVIWFDARGNFDTFSLSGAPMFRTIDNCSYACFASTANDAIKRHQKFMLAQLRRKVLT